MEPEEEEGSWETRWGERQGQIMLSKDCAVGTLGRTLGRGQKSPVLPPVLRAGTQRICAE